MDEKIKKYLFDILTSIASIKEFLGTSVDFKAYLSNKMLKRAVEREFEIIGEALNNIFKIDKTIIITNIRRIIDFRNLLIHGYSSISDKVVWSIIENDLEVLLYEVERFLGEKSADFKE